MFKRGKGLMNGQRDPWLNAVSPDTTVENVYRRKTPANKPGSTKSKCVSPVRSPDTTFLDEGDSEPWLEIIDQPVESVRFRYLSELQGTPHGPLFARSSHTEKGSRGKKKKTYPTVQLHNCNREAKVRCWLVTGMDNPDVHVHDLVTRSKGGIVYEPHSRILNRNNNFTASFENMVVLHSVSKHLKMFWKKKLLWDHRRDHPDRIDESQIEEINFKEVKDKFDLNIVYLYFEAYIEHRDSIEIICSTVSEGVRNLKNPEAGELKIVRCSSKRVGRPAGGDELFVFCSRLPKDMRIEFFSEEHDWVKPAIFDPTDVHCQCAIVFRTPPFPFAEKEDVKVSFRLVRTSDLMYSNSCDYTYSPHAREFGLAPLPLHQKIEKPTFFSAKKRKLGDFEDLKPFMPEESAGSNNDVIIQNILDADSDMPSFHSSDQEALLNKLDGDRMVGEVGLNEEVVIENVSMMGDMLLGEEWCPTLDEFESLSSPLIAADGPSNSHANTTWDMSTTQVPRTQANATITSTTPTTQHHSPTTLSGMLVKLGFYSLLTRIFKLADWEALKWFQPEWLISVGRGIVNLFHRWTTSQGSQENRAKPHEKYDLFQLMQANELQRFRNKMQETQCLLQRSENDRTILHEAVVKKKTQFIVALTECGRVSDWLTARDLYGDTLFHSASRHDSNSILKLLLRSRSSPHSLVRKLINLTNYEGLNCLHIAAVHGRSCMIAPLVNAGLHPDSPDDSSGKTALMHAASYERNEFITSLIEHGADLNVKNWAGHTVLDICTFNGYEEMAKDFQMLGAQHGTLIGEEDEDYFSGSDSSQDKEVQPTEKAKCHNSAALFSAEEVEQMREELEGDGWKRVADMLGEEYLISSFSNSPNPSAMLINFIELHKTELLGKSCEEQSAALIDVFQKLGMKAAVNVCKNKALQ